MNKKQTFIIFGILIILLLLALIFKVSQENKKVKLVDKTPVINQSENIAAATVTENLADKYKTEAPRDIIIPEMNDRTLNVEQKKEIATPTLVVPAAPGSSSSLRNFDIKAEGGKFTPFKIIGKLGDTMVVNFTAVDRDYSIFFPSYNMKQTAKKGETKTLGFHAGESGSFTYYCDICGANTTASGTLIIAN